MMLRICLIIALTLGGLSSLRAQALLGVDTIASVLPDTVSYSQTDTFNLVIVKEDSGSYLGPFQVDIQRFTGGTWTTVQTATNNNANFQSIGATVNMDIVVTFSPAIWDTGWNPVRVQIAGAGVFMGTVLTSAIYVNPPGGLLTILSSPGTLALLNDSVPFGTQLTIPFQVVNTGTTPVLGPTAVVYGRQVGSVVTALDSGFINSTIDPNDTATTTVNVDVTSPDFLLGGNGVVVWPIAPDGEPSDTLFALLTVYEQTGIGENWVGYEELLLYPNPSNGVLRLQNSGLSTTADHVRIFDLSGRLIVEYDNQPYFDISNYPPGLYFVQVTLEGNRSKTFKVQKN